MTTLRGSLGLFTFVALLVVLTACGGAAPKTGVHPNDSWPSTVGVTLDTFEIVPSTETVHAGPITFEANNKSALTHEMLVVRVRDVEQPQADERLASVGQVGVETGEGPAEDRLVNQLLGESYDWNISRLVEDKINSLGEVADITGGTGGSVTLDLPPGQYLLLCNITAHFQSGMHARLTVMP